MLPELLAPGGSFDGIRAAVNAGADAVYAGGKCFGARAYAENPDTDKLLEAIDYCHLHGAKLYLTVNTLLKERELEERLEDSVRPAYEHGVDGVLVQDFGVFRALRRSFPDLPLHASTQMTVTGADGVQLLARMGAQRVVLARELSLSEIRGIRAQTDVELEAFVHGALCFCYSGQCLLSSVIGGRSGNRGRCAQPCRLPYDLLDREGRQLNKKGERYLMSLKDICALRILPDLIEAGIASLKIEGRMKSPEYAAGITSVYRKYLNLYAQKGRSGYRVDPADERLTEELFHRGPTFTGAYLEPTGAERMLLRERQRESGEALRRAQETAQQVRTRFLDAEPVLPVQAEVTLHTGAPAALRVQIVRPERADAHRAAGGTSGAAPAVCVQGAEVLPARSRPLDEATVRRQLTRSGDTAFSVEACTIAMDDDAFLPVSALNALRREALERLQEELLRPHRRFFVQSEADSAKMPAAGKHPAPHPAMTASVRTQEQLRAVLADARFSGIYLDEGLDTPGTVRRVQEAGRKAYLMLPYVWRQKIAARYADGPLREALELADGALLRSFDELEFLHRIAYRGERIADAGLYTWNREARAMLASLGVTTDTLPLECARHELAERGCAGSEWIVYGYQSVMITENCLTKTVCGCTRQPDVRFLRDRTGARFPVQNRCGICTNVLYNSVPLDLTQIAREETALHPASLRWSFTVEDGAGTRRILEGVLPDHITRGAFRKGVE